METAKAGELGVFQPWDHPEYAGLLAVAREVLGGGGPAFLLGIRGYEFEMFSERLSTGAGRNLAAAVAFLAPILGGESAAVRLTEVASAFEAAAAGTG